MRSLDRLRAALTDDASRTAWWEVEAALDEAPPAELDILLAYAREHAEDWPGLERLTRWRRFLSLEPDSPLLSLIYGVDVRRARLSPDDVDALLAHPGWDGLTALDLDESDTEPVHIWRLLEGAPRRLRTLIMHRNPLGDNLARYIPEALRLRDLWLEGVGMSGFGVAALCANPALTGLKTLHLGDNRIGPEGCAALCGCPLLRSLWILDLKRAEITPQAADLLAASPFLQSVMVLDVRGNPLGTQGLEALRAGRSFRTAEILHD